MNASTRPHAPTTTGDPRPPEHYPHTDWQTEGDYAVPVNLRSAYAASTVDRDESIRKVARKELAQQRSVTRDEADALGAAGLLTSEYGEAGIGITMSDPDDDRRILVREIMTDDGLALHHSRLAEAKRATAPPNPLLVPVVSVCQGCGHEERRIPMQRSEIRLASPGPEFIAAAALGLAGVPLCLTCRASLPGVLALAELPDGRSRAGALISLASSVMQPRAEADRAAVIAIAEAAIAKGEGR